MRFVHHQKVINDFLPKDFEPNPIQKNDGHTYDQKTLIFLGEVVVFLFPSYLCYSYQGDADKIGVNQPLRFTIERLPLN